MVAEAAATKAVTWMVQGFGWPLEMGFNRDHGRPPEQEVVLLVRNEKRPSTGVSELFQKCGAIVLTKRTDVKKNRQLSLEFHIIGFSDYLKAYHLPTNKCCAKSTPLLLSCSPAE